MQLRGNAKFLSARELKTKTGKEIMLYTLVDTKSYEKIVLAGSKELNKIEPESNVNYEVSLRKNGQYTNFYLVGLDAE